MSAFIPRLARTRPALFPHRYPQLTASPPTLAAPSQRYFHPSIPSSTTAGYGDPQSEKIKNYTPTPKPSSSADPQPDGQGKGAGQKSGSTDPEVSAKSGTAEGNKGEVGNAGGEPGAGGGGENVKEKQFRETKKVGEDPKKEEVGGAGVTGG